MDKAVNNMDKAANNLDATAAAIDGRRIAGELVRPQQHDRLVIVYDRFGIKQNINNNLPSTSSTAASALLTSFRTSRAPLLRQLRPY
jgi:hypothetical protein